jgi:hypothetical protein
VFWSVEKLVGLLYTFRRRTFWRRWPPKLSKLSQHFFFDLVRELSVKYKYNSVQYKEELGVTLVIRSIWAKLRTGYFPNSSYNVWALETFASV